MKQVCVKCRDCGAMFWHESEQTTCPECGSDRVHAPASVVFDGHRCRNVPRDFAVRGGSLKRFHAKPGGGAR
jgi:DNA-directed RNA polymerase subunit RPC12/RpoP